MKPETKANKAVIAEIKRVFPKTVIQKHADRFTSGIVDLEVVLPGGITCWIENKFIPSPPKRGIALVSERMVKPLQVEFLNDRAKLEVPCFVVVTSKIHNVWVFAVYDPRALPEKVKTCDFTRTLGLEFWLMSLYNRNW